MAALIRAAAPALAPLLLAAVLPAVAHAGTAADPAIGSAPPVAETPPPAPPAVERWRPFIAEASERFGVPQAWIAAVMAVESAGQTMRAGRPITSRAGAMGLMQLMPATWAAMRARHGLGPDPHDPHDNIMAGAAYLRAMHDQFGYPGLFAAYNAGPARYAAHLHAGTPLAAETRTYIVRLARTPATPAMPPAMLSGTRLFFTLGGAGEPASTPAPTPSANLLFVPLGPAQEARP